MIPLERQDKILALVADRDAISINELAQQLRVSHMTVRRDIRKLEDEGRLLAVSGGVRSMQRLQREPSHLDKTLMHSPEKQAIGHYAVRQIPPDSCIYLDAGTTTLALARQLGARSDLLIVTNDFAISDFLIQHAECRMLHTGGMLCRENRSCVGEATAQALRNICIDIAFVSASCWNTGGLCTPDENKVAVKRAARAASSKCILLSDSSKYGKVATWRALPLNEFDEIITDQHLASHGRDALQQTGARVVMVPVEPPTSGKPAQSD
ncbi:DeoR family transcriptional regulator [Erwinia sp. OLTSP20]|uniref:DeoR/GlpR family DNA-binding transcription regulator n=1 Tax=unclassified Erwinia TaxID=2622719 RepID=UPI000C1A1663|nr:MULTISPECIES: DeoR/GlpR family DNA-binding transcription regulator [unclassified Erwinia]PIJ52024.1 DeoR family transcriptional regulator [Erwinia sp. OAMSP11]PIJ75187.1 DeoR family transcriptional regulator [Erwinia sp. OLSSP12]PIJ84395.1 DeoR family transcriptional regulator [Erwinia sp. OLCASP19]PIJ87008.1 DeoR family transcriptional regulator [Erwinia sp. OLMTSP26]PIJ88572.1 DeoR family transcriptional regulator [Erwinia sp. OLMDSP33]